MKYLFHQIELTASERPRNNAKNFYKVNMLGEVVVAQLVERSLPIPEVRGSNPVIGKNLYRTFTVNCIEKTKIKKKRPGMAHFKKKLICSTGESPVANLITALQS